MKIAITFADFTAARHVGADIERETYVIEVPDSCFPAHVLKSIKLKQEQPSKCDYTVSLSVVVTP